MARREYAKPSEFMTTTGFRPSGDVVGLGEGEWARRFVRYRGDVVSYVWFTYDDGDNCRMLTEDEARHLENDTDAQTGEVVDGDYEYAGFRYRIWRDGARVYAVPATGQAWQAGREKHKRAAAECWLQDYADKRR